MGKFDEYGVSLGNFLLKSRWLVLFVILLTFAGMFMGGEKLSFNNNYRVFFGDDNPDLQAFDDLQALYTKTDNAVFVLKPKDGNAFSREVLSAIQYITEESWKLPRATRVDSLTNYQHTEAVGDDLTVADLVEGDPQELTDAELAKIRKVALNEPLLLSRVVNPEGTAAGVAVTVSLDEDDPAAVSGIVAKANEMLDKVRAEHPDIDIRASGIVYMNGAFEAASMNDLQTLIPLMYAILLFSMVIFLRSLFGTIATLFVIFFSAAGAMGIAGWMGVQLTPPSATAPTIILTLAIADSIHIIVTMLKEMQNGMTKREAIVESLRINLQPVFLTSVTTAIGFLSLNFSDAPPFHDLGNIVAVGVILAFFYSVTLLPILLSLFPIKTPKRKVKGRKDYMDDFASFVIAKHKILLPISVAVVLMLGVAMSKIELNDQFVQYFSEDIAFRGDTEFMIENLTGVYQLEFSVGANGSQAITEPEYIAKLDEFALWLREQPEVMNVYSLTDIAKRLNKNMHGDDPAWYRVTETREMAAQYLLLYEFSLPYGLDLNDRMNVDKSATRLTATTIDLSTKDFLGLKNRAEGWLHDNTPEHMHSVATSPMVMFSFISKRNIEQMLLGNFVAIIVISIAIMLALKSFRMGMISLIPNLVPAIMGFGIWAIFIGQINMAVAVITAIALGIIVDDTVHFLSKYLRGRREKGLSAEEAVRYSFNMVGTALVVTTLVLVIGFLVLTLSSFQMNSHMGALTAITIGCALIADFFLLPSLLIKLDKDKSYD